MKRDLFDSPADGAPAAASDLLLAAAFVAVLIAIAVGWL